MILLRHFHARLSTLFCDASDKFTYLPYGYTHLEGQDALKDQSFLVVDGVYKTKYSRKLAKPTFIMPTMVHQLFQ